MRAAALHLVIGLLLGTACQQGPTLPHAKASVNIQDNLQIAAYYAREASLSRRKAEELSNRAVVYERLFGSESDWVVGAQLLTQFYEESAREQERQANNYLELAGGRASARETRSSTP